MMRPMPGTNLTRDEAQTRARLLGVDSYTVELDLTTSETTFASTTTIAFTLHRAGRRDASPTSSARPSTRSRSTARRSTRPRCTPTTGSRCRASRPTTQLVVRADCPYSRTGEGLHRFVDPADDRVYTYTQFEVPDARRVFTTFEQPDLKSVFTFHVTAPEDWVVVSNAPTPEPQALGDGTAVWDVPGDRADVDLHHRDHRRRVPRGVRHLRGTHGEIPLGHYCRQSLVEHMDTDELVKLTSQGFAFFEDAFDYPYPFHKYDQLYVPEYNMGAMENAGAVTLRDEYLPRSRQDALVLRVPLPR